MSPHLTLLYNILDFVASRIILHYFQTTEMTSGINFRKALYNLTLLVM